MQTIVFDEAIEFTMCMIHTSDAITVREFFEKLQKFILYFISFNVVTDEIKLLKVLILPNHLYTISSKYMKNFSGLISGIHLDFEIVSIIRELTDILIEILYLIYETF